jgi:CTP synthase
VPFIYEVPLGFAEEGVDSLILKYLHKDAPDADNQMEGLVDRCYHPKDEVSIAIVGKYVEYEDSYKSLKEALTHGPISQNLKLNVIPGSRPKGWNRKLPKIEAMNRS